MINKIPRPAKSALNGNPGDRRHPGRPGSQRVEREDRVVMEIIQGDRSHSM